MSKKSNSPQFKTPGKISSRQPENGSGQQKSAKELSKVTLYVRPDQVIAIEDIQLQHRKKTGVRPDKSTLVQEALDLLIAKYNRRGSGS